MAIKKVAVMEPHVGDWADHRYRDLDPRRVTKVEDGQVWLELGRGKVMGPFPASNYWFRREENSDGA